MGSTPAGQLLVTLDDGAWRVVPAGGGRTVLLSGVDCFQVARCAAAGGYSTGSTDWTYGERVVGTSTSVFAMTNPGAPDSLAGVSCTSAQWCVAVSYWTGDGLLKAVLSREFSGGGWHTVPVPDS